MPLLTRRIFDLSPPALLFEAPATAHIYTLSLHDALPIYSVQCMISAAGSPSATSSIAVGTGATGFTSYGDITATAPVGERSEEHTSELQSRPHLVCRLLLEKNNREDRKSTRLNSSHQIIS